MKKYTSYAVLVHLMLLLISNQLVAQNDPSQKIESAIQQMMQSNPVVGLSVAVVKNNKIIYNHSFGFKDLEQQIPLNNQNIFRIASISKSFTATAMMQLVAKKQVSLDQDVSELIGFKVRNPKFPNKVITLKMILYAAIGFVVGYVTLELLYGRNTGDTLDVVYFWLSNVMIVLAILLLIYAFVRRRTLIKLSRRIDPDHA